MGGIVETQVGEFSLGEAFMIGVAKSLTERLLSPVVGNGTYMSGAVKLGGAYMVPKLLKNKIGKVTGTALAVDGVEDIINALTNSFFSGGNSSGDAWIV